MIAVKVHPTSSPKRLRALPVMSAVACAWLLLAAGCGGGGGDPATPSANVATPSQDGGTDTQALVADPISTALDSATPVETAPVNLVGESYFPIAMRDKWTYAQALTENLTLSNHTIERTVLSAPDLGATGEAQVKEEIALPPAPGGDTDKGQRIEEFTVSAEGITLHDPLDIQNIAPGVYAAIESMALVKNVTQAVGTVVSLDRTGDAQADFDEDGQNDTFSLHAEQVFKGFKTIDVMGKPTVVAHMVTTFVVDYHLSRYGTTQHNTFVQAEAYAQGLGLVQSERVTYARGKEVRRNLLTLTSAHVDGIDYVTDGAN